jgi:thymidylate synthase ThyX
MFLDDYEEFSPEEKKILEQFVSNTNKNVFVLKNLPEVIKGALFSRYSRSTLGLRKLLLKEFIGNNQESSFSEIAIAGHGDSSNTLIQKEAIAKAQAFYDRILDGYGDDSIGELGGAHLAVENVSMLAAKAIEDLRIGGSPLEKSTRYIPFDQKVNGEYLFYREPILMTSAYRDLYLDTCNFLFDTYSKLIAPLTDHFQQKFPKDEATSKGGYATAIRAKVFDCLRGLLPASTLTNLGVFGNGRFYESLIRKLHLSPLAEMQEIGRRAYDELHQVIPSFVRRAAISHPNHQAFQKFYDEMETEIRMAAAAWAPSYNEDVVGSVSAIPLVKLIDYDKDSPKKVASALLFADSPFGLNSLNEMVEELPDEEVEGILDAASLFRENRRHKSPRALELASYTFEIIADFGAYRDLQRHRMLTQERQLLTCDLGYYIPDELVGTPFEEPYMAAQASAKSAFDQIQGELPEEAQYIVPMAYNIRFFFHINLRALQWLSELRSQPQGHTTYRFVAQALAQKVQEVHPSFARFFRFVDFSGHSLGRLSQEEKKEAKIGQAT